MSAQKRVIACAVLVAVGLCLSGADADAQKVPVDGLGTKFVLMGRLEKPLGTFMTIEGQKGQPVEQGGDTVEVDVIDGVKLAKPVTIEFRGGRVPGEGRVILRGYETGSMAGVPVDPLRKETPSMGKRIPYQFVKWFQITDDKQPPASP